MGAKLPTNEGMLQRLAGVTTQEWTRLWPLVAPYWTEKDGHLENETQVEIYADAMKRKQTKIDRAKKGAEARWSKAREMPEQCSSNAEGPAKQCPPSPSLSKSLDADTENDLPVATQPSAAEAAQTNHVAAIRAVFDYFKTGHNHPRARLSKARKKLIRARLNDDYTVEDLKLAIDGLHLSKWHTTNGHLTLEYGLRNSDKIEGLQSVATDEHHADRIGRADLPDRTRRTIDAAERFARRHAHG